MHGDYDDDGIDNDDHGVDDDDNDDNNDGYYDLLAALATRQYPIIQLDGKTLWRSFGMRIQLIATTHSNSFRLW